MVLALLTFLIMFQMFESWDRSKRATASGGGAMISGALAMFRFERDLRLAGFGFGNAQDLGCSVAAYHSSRPNTAAADGLSSATDASHNFSFSLVPLQIVDGTAGAPDQVIILYASSEGISTTRFFGTGATGAKPFTSSTSTSVTMDIGGRGGIEMGDLIVIAQNSTTCQLAEVTDNTNSDRLTVAFGTSNYTHHYTGASTAPRYNSASGMTVAAPPGDRLPNVYVLGPSPQRRVWHIRNNRTLSFVNDFWVDSVNNTTGAATADSVNDVTDVADNVINLQAEYGIATTPGSAAEPLCTPTNNPDWRTDIPAGCNAFVWAVRVALLARSDQFEKTWGVPASGSAAVAPSWAGGSFTMTNLDGTSDSYTTSTLTSPSKNPNDWRHYRYKVYESIIPLKNVMWGSR